MRLRPCPQEETRRASLPQHFPVNSLERRPAVEPSQFEPAEHLPVPHEMDSDSSRRLPAPEFHLEQFGSSVAMTQRREVWTKCFEGLDSPRLAGLPQVK